MLEPTKPYFALSKFQDEYAVRIIHSVVNENITENLADFYIHLSNKQTKMWMLQCTGYAIKICTDNLFIRTYAFYLQLFEKIAKRYVETGKFDEETLRLSILHMSNIFSNPSFTSDSIRLRLHTTINKFYTNTDIQWPTNIKKLILDFLLYGAKSFKDNFDISSKYGNLALDLLCKYDPPQIEDYDYFSSVFEELFKYDFFQLAWIQKFEQIYKENIRLKSIGSEKPIMKYFIKQINEKLSRNFQTLAFWKVINNLTISNSDRVIYSKLPIQDVCEKFLSWFDPNIDLKFLNMENFSSFHPLFKLAEQSKYYEYEELDAKVDKYIEFILKTPPGKENLQFWLFPVHANDYIHYWPRIEEFLDDFRNYFQRIYEMIMDNSKFHSIISSFFEKVDQSIQKTIEKIKSEIIVSTLSLIHVIFKSECTNDDSIKNIISELSKKSQSAQLYSWFNILSENHTKEILPIDTNPCSSIYLVMIASSINILGKSFYQEQKRKIKKIIKHYSSLLNESQFTHVDEIARVIFSFYQIAICTPFFFDHPNVYQEIIHSNIAQRQDPTITSIIDMFKLAVLSGQRSEIDINELYSNSNDFMYATPQYIISISKNNFVVRHGIGISMFEVEELVPYDNFIKDSTKLDEKIPNQQISQISAFSDQKSTTKEMDEADRLESLLIDTPTEFKTFNYQNEIIDNEHHAHRLLSDLNLILYRSNTLRRLDDSKLIPELDKIKLNFPIYIVQLTMDKEMPRFGFVPSDLRGVFLKDLSNSKDYLNTASILYKIELDINIVIPEYIKTSKSADFVQKVQEFRELNPVRSPMIVVLNETGLEMNSYSAIFNNFNAIVEIIPNFENFSYPYIVNITFQNDVLECEDLQVNKFSIPCLSDGISSLIMMLTSIMTTSRSCLHCGRGIGSFFERRKKLISSIFKGGLCGNTQFIANVAKTLGNF
ncbi:hypothetical protein TVAG_222970 [Trichomonas vaginalis G3]|uniref:Uncharacterized protein n=1 Tax=Trichomonas vaginalis (strain ATCC PRA-98 / G3) TaxID=412133 RepID=A2G795_TRIV3|nr:hypothetical protein TVAGG3_0085270 [Trichomonas vaginalis G3]EAX86972.1 hypothetical protein TVAG_222970 [Trichomonas vaginalis G3]KAI5543555.1 hypothetical protein TVAGG3_0085270 [Trichomonas vaginalis G3]|eukprot:XP_001299902.1 hypothetical protein [Trichomonas vaginalis G3]